MAYMSIDRMREEILSVYPEGGWEEKVEKMPYYQIIAIYHSMLERGMFDTEKKKSGNPILDKQFNVPDKPIRSGRYPWGMGEQIKFDI